MGLPAPVIDLIISEHRVRPINGDVAFIAKQSTFATEKSLAYFQKKYGITPPKNFQIEIDTQTRSALGSQFKRRLLNSLLSESLKKTIRGTKLATLYKSWVSKKEVQSAPIKLVTDRCVMNFLAAKSFSTIDVSDYEGAEIICDLSMPLPACLHAKFDFIFNGSCLDNIFNPAQAISNLSKMLKPGGRLVMIEHGTMANGPYTAFSPGWFFDFFCYNKYKECKIYHGLFKDNTTLHYGPWPVYLFNWIANKNGNSPTIRNREHIMYLVVAEKGVDSTDDLLPIQHQYRDSEFEKTVFLPQALKMLEHLRISKQLDYDPSAPFLRCGFLGKDIPF